MLEKKKIKCTQVIQKHKNGLNLNTTTVTIFYYHESENKFSFCRIRKFEAGILHHVHGSCKRLVNNFLSKSNVCARSNELDKHFPRGYHKKKDAIS